MSQDPPIFKIPSNEDHERVSALFLGPKAENEKSLRDCFELIVSKQSEGRRAYFPNDPVCRILCRSYLLIIGVLMDLPHICARTLFRRAFKRVQRTPTKRKRFKRSCRLFWNISTSGRPRSTRHATVRICVSTRAYPPSSAILQLCSTIRTMSRSKVALIPHR